MKRNTKQEILNVSRRLFNEKGYNAVSIQQIADEVGISKGNLTYHFEKKEQIMEALLITDRPDTLPKEVPQTLAELDLVFLDMETVVKEASWFFLNYAQLSQTSPEICQKQTERYNQLRILLTQALKKLQEAGMLREAEFDGEYEHMADTLHLSIIYWAPFTQLQHSAGMPDMEYRKHAWSLLHHLLTEKGRDELKDLLIL